MAVYFIHMNNKLWRWWGPARWKQPGRLLENVENNSPPRPSYFETVVHRSGYCSTLPAVSSPCPGRKGHSLDCWERFSSCLPRCRWSGRSRCWPPAPPWSRQCSRWRRCRQRPGLPAGRLSRRERTDNRMFDLLDLLHPSPSHPAPGILYLDFKNKV